MKNLLLMLLLVLTVVTSEVYGQSAPTVTTPSVSGDKNLSDDTLKARSAELNRVERDAKKTDGTKGTSANPKNASAEDKLAAMYEEIKSDYENIQLSQDAVIKSYQAAGKIDFESITKNAAAINKSANRLNENLFPVVAAEQAQKNDDKKKDDQPKAEKSIRNLIVELDNAIGGFVTSPMFQNLRVIDPEVSAKAKQQLEAIIQLSASLERQAKKSATP